MSSVSDKSKVEPSSGTSPGTADMPGWMGLELLGSHDEGGEGETLVALVVVQGLMGQQETVVQHIEPPQEVCVDLHLLQEPGPLPLQRDVLPFKVEVFKNHDDVAPLRRRLRPTAHLAALNVVPGIDSIIRIKHTLHYNEVFLPPVWDFDPMNT